MRGLWILTLLMATIVMQLAWFMYYFFTPPVDSIRVDIKTPIVKYGDNVILTYTYNRNEWCETTVDRYIVNTDINTLIRRERVPAGALPLGKGSLNVLLPTKLPINAVVPIGISDPSIGDLTPGKYILREVAHNRCGMRALVTIPITNTTFEVVP